MIKCPLSIIKYEDKEMTLKKKELGNVKEPEHDGFKNKIISNS